MSHTFETNSFTKTKYSTPYKTHLNNANKFLKFRIWQKKLCGLTEMFLDLSNWCNNLFCFVDVIFLKFVKTTFRVKQYTYYTHGFLLKSIRHRINNIFSWNCTVLYLCYSVDNFVLLSDLQFKGENTSFGFWWAIITVIQKTYGCYINYIKCPASILLRQAIMILDNSYDLY